MSGFVTPLRVEEVDEFGGLWELLQPLAYDSDLLGRIEVPAGFVTDFASVPRLPVIYLTEGGKGNKAAVVHDYLYTVGSATGKVTRLQADQVLREALLASGYSAATAGVFYAAVRVGGGSHWKAPNVPQDAPVQAQIDAGSLVAP